LGFEGQVVKVRPGYADRILVPEQIAVYNFPGTHGRLYPNWDVIEKDIFHFLRKLLFFKKERNMNLNSSQKNLKI
jgi:hypothetical protein